MKKIICIYLCFVLLILSGCSTSKTTEKVENEILNEYLKNISEFETPVREFGKNASFICMDDAISVGILYPETEYDFLNAKIKKYVEDLADEYIKDANENEKNKAELSVSYNSYIVGKSTISIEISGTYFPTYMAHPIDIIKTFNADIESKKLINIHDIIKENSIDDFKKLIISKASVDVELVDDGFFDNLVIKKEGIGIILNRGEYTPMSDGTKTVFVDYSEIFYMIRESFDYKNNKPQIEESDLPLQKEELATKIDPNKPMIALTFDDGPSAHTERLLEIFKEHGGKGTFFVIGNLIDKRKNTLIRVANEGHEIGGHSWNHRQLTKLSKSEVKDQIMMTRAKIYNLTGIDSLIVRPPYGACNDDVKSVGKNLGVSFINWSLDTLDWKTKNPTSIYNEIIKNASNGDIILCHDLHKTTVDAMERVIPKLLADGFQLVTVSQLMKYSKNELLPGKIYYKQ